MRRHTAVVLAILMVVSAGVFAGEIHEAVQSGDLAAVTRLLEAEPESVNEVEARFGTMPLHMAVYFGRTDIARLLIKSGADLEAPGLQGWTPLVMAALRGRFDIVELLLEAGADPRAASTNGELPLIAAASRGEVEIANTLIAAGARADARGGGGSTALHAAAFAGFADMTEILISHGASPEFENGAGNTPLDLALERDHYRVAARLCEAAAQNREAAAGASAVEIAPVADPDLIEPKITVLYDNYVFTEGTRADWGFSCLIEGGEKVVLFDTGTKPEILLANAAALEVDLSRVEVVVISHDHGDHTGGLVETLRLAPEAVVYLPPSISYERFASIEGMTSSVFFPRDPTRIIKGAVLTGELGDDIREQSLLLNTPRGVVVVAGCSHPGIETIASRSRQVIDRPIELILGGFHMGHLDAEQVQATIDRLKALGVKAAAPTHCTGERAIALFKSAFAEDFVEAGVGRELVFGADED